MATRKPKKCSPIVGSNNFDPLSIVKFHEMPLEVEKKLKDLGIDVLREEASEILALAHNLAKITIKEFILNQD
ncbi:hypothetical protein [Chryseobacterium sp. 22458]|uniref:hypothetical protein n=1 Tax=Chryseobacterium sp. 22458 TaxID=3453921 RepID=UPI003F853667